MAKFVIRLRDPAPEINYVTGCVRRMPRYTTEIDDALSFRSYRKAEEFIYSKVLVDMRKTLVVTTAHIERDATNAARRARQQLQPVSHDMPLREFEKILGKAYHLGGTG